MSLKSLTFTTLPQATIDPKTDRRNRIIAKLEEQKAFHKDAKFTRTIKNRIEKDGKKVTIEEQQKVLPWWRSVPNGTFAFFIRAGVKAVEFEKGKTAVAVPTFDKIPGVIDALIAAVKAGELDAQLAAASKQVGGKRKKAA